MSREGLVRRVELEAVAADFIKALQEEVAPQPVLDVEKEWIETKVDNLKALARPGDQIWFYRYEKCCGWYREGYVLVRGSCLVAEINTREDM